MSKPIFINDLVDVLDTIFLTLTDGPTSEVEFLQSEMLGLWVRNDAGAVLFYPWHRIARFSVTPETGEGIAWTFEDAA